ncbi:HigA family addiction module antidote protein [Candidatus Sumerlaeota bacterium]|nr:HigA family addiction module antidote protein [Candidatus Sumerlaeota bacterium]
MNDRTRKPAEVFPPGEFIKDILDGRGLTQADLADILGRTQAEISNIISGKTSITPDTACQLSAAFDTSPDVWLNAETAYRLSLATTPSSEIRQRASLYEYAPSLKEMFKRNWIAKTDDLTQLASDLCKFFAVPSLDEPPKIELAARSSATPSGHATRAQITWACRCLYLASALQVHEFNLSSAKSLVLKLRALAAHPEGVREVPRVMSDAGIRFLIVEHLSQTKMDGAALWLNKDSPVIALTIRQNRLDNFWFTLLHELSHILHGDGYRLDEDLLSDANKAHFDAVETRANSEAADTLIGQEALESFIRRVSPFYSKSRIIQFANRQRIHPGIVVGQLQHRGEIHWRTNKEMLPGIRDQITSTALTDGWGRTIS